MAVILSQLQWLAADITALPHSLQIRSVSILEVFNKGSKQEHVTVKRQICQL